MGVNNFDVHEQHMQRVVKAINNYVVLAIEHNLPEYESVSHLTPQELIEHLGSRLAIIYTRYNNIDTALAITLDRTTIYKRRIDPETGTVIHEVITNEV